MPNPFSTFLSRVFSPLVERSVREALSVTENDNTFFIGTRRYDETDRDRLEYNRQDILEQSLDAWRLHPIARRIVELTSQYVVGGGLDIKTEHDPTHAFINLFWNHRLNRMDSRIIELCDELTRSGNLFILISTDQAGMSYIRTIPAASIDQITPSPNDIEQPLSFTTKPDPDTLQPHTYPAFDPLTDSPDSTGHFPPVILHYAINRPAGAQWGDSDLAPVLIWLSRYSAWLEDRVRLNRFRNAFLYVVSGSFTSEVARKARQTELAANPPTPGSILVTDETETWNVISPKLEALDANQDGLAIKKMIAASVGVPLHFLAEPESSTRTTAESAGGPTFRRFEQRQEFFLWLLSDLLGVVIGRRSQIDPSVKPDPDLKISGADISARDNVSHAIAGTNVLNMLERLYDMGLIDSRELLRVAYRFAGENVDLDEILARGSGVDRRESTTPIEPITKDPDTVNPQTGEAKKSVTNP